MVQCHKSVTIFPPNPSLATSGIQYPVRTGSERNQRTLGAALALDESIGAREGRNRSPYSYAAVSLKQDPLSQRSREFTTRLQAAWNSRTPASHVVLASLMLLIASLFLFFVLSPAWKTMSTDFPNYYTAALELRRGCSLTDLYDWTWFQRQMNYAGFGRQRGAYTPQTPLTMVPFVPLTWVSPLTAKRIWIVLNCGLLASSLWLLSTVTRFNVVQLSILAACGWNTWRTNFMYGQYYVFLLFLLTLLFVCVYRLREKSAGFLAGIIFAMKLYSGPYLLFFAARKKWNAAAIMAVTILVSSLAAIALFGWHSTA